MLELTRMRRAGLVGSMVAGVALPLTANAQAPAATSFQFAAPCESLQRVL
jgi:hypothetical protein